MEWSPYLSRQDKKDDYSRETALPLAYKTEEQDNTTSYMDKQLISAYEIVLNPLSTVQQRKDAELVKPNYSHVF